MTDYNALWAEIQANPACAPHIVPSFPKVDAATARAGDQAIADILSAGRTAVVPTRVSARGFAAAYPGTPEDAEGVLMKLEAARDAMLASGDAATVKRGSMLRRQLAFMDGDGLDFGESALRGMLDLFSAAGIITAAEAENMKSLAEKPEVITAAQVSRAVRGPRD